jgi:hypothetical protein
MNAQSPATNTIETDDPVLARVFRGVYEAVASIQDPFLIRVFSISGRSPLRITIENFAPLPARALTHREVAGIRGAIRLLETRGIVLTRITRHSLGVVDGRIKLCVIADAGVVSPTDPYKWKTRPMDIDFTKSLMRSCDFDSYISGVYKLSEITACAARRFFASNTAMRKKELKKRKLIAIRDAARGEFLVRHYLQTGNDIDKIPTPALRKFFGLTQARRDLQDRLRLERQGRNRERLRQAAARPKKKSLVFTRDTIPEEILQIQVMDPILYQERALGQVLADRHSDYRVLLVREAGGVVRPALYENRTPDIVYRCVDDRPWKDFLRQQDYFFNIRTFDGGRYLIPRMALPRIMVVEPSEDVFRVVSREAIQEMDFTSRLHCQDGSETRLYRPDTTETQRMNRWLSRRQQASR